MFKKVILPAIAYLFFVASFISLLPIWIGDLFSHFRMFWAFFSVILFIIYIIFFSQKKIHFKIVMSVFFSLLINVTSSYSFWTNSETYQYLFFGSPTLETFSHSSPNENVQKDTTVKSLLLMNVLSSNTNYEKARELIRNADADFVVILELNKKWKNELKELNKNYPYKFTEVREDNFGMGIYSKTDFTDSHIVLGDKYLNQINKELNEGLKKWSSDVNLDIRKINGVELREPAIFVKGKAINIMLLHPIPPINRDTYIKRNKYLEKKVEVISKTNTSKTLLVGDFNCSPFSADYKKFLKQSGLKDSQQNFGFQPTWNSSFPFLMQTQLDHVWHSEDIEILHRQTLPIEGSDHKAVLVLFR
ncbi:endonuclease/exonuclease/phosphatase family protein [Bernardetia sp. MNP-M8]|uniref:endonuclease/exonuclease/phosphatase family protein n=1 Tax=Bernardetia sp. MNP-M8 TaxID=3127470 RepID=UPI0030D1F0E6